MRPYRERRECREAEGKDGSGVHRVPKHAPRPRERGAGGGVQALEHLLVEEVGEPLEEVEQRWRVVVGEGDGNECGVEARIAGRGGQCRHEGAAGRGGGVHARAARCTCVWRGGALVKAGCGSLRGYLRKCQTGGRSADTEQASAGQG